MHIEQLRYLILVHRLGSIKKASEQTHLSQQALNVSMKKLEEEIGYPLFVRHARGVNLSENGRILEQAAEKILQELDDAMQKMQHEQESPAASMERLQVYSAPSVNRGFIRISSTLFQKNIQTRSLCSWKRNPIRSFKCSNRNRYRRWRSLLLLRIHWRWGISIRYYRFFGIRFM